MIKTGAQHIEMLKDGRQVYINGRLAGDITDHPAFRRTVRSVGALYDFQARPDNQQLMTFEIPESSGRRANRIWQLPQNHGDLVERRKGLEASTELHCGFLGRAPDHVASCLSGMFMGIEVFEAYDGSRATALADYYRYARDNDLYLAYVIINPQADRSKSAGVLYFDDIKVPWERVFINQDIAMCQRQFHATPAHVFQNYQAQVRLMVKMGFLLGLAWRIAEINGVIAFPPVREALGALAAQSTMVDALVHAMEVKGAMHGPYFVPDAHTLYSAQVLTQQMYAQAIIALASWLAAG